MSAVTIHTRVHSTSTAHTTLLIVYASRGGFSAAVAVRRDDDEALALCVGAPVPRVVCAVVCAHSGSKVVQTAATTTTTTTRSTYADEVTRAATRNCAACGRRRRPEVDVNPKSRMHAMHARRTRMFGRVRVRVFALSAASDIAREYLTRNPRELLARPSPPRSCGRETHQHITCGIKERDTCWYCRHKCKRLCCWYLVVRARQNVKHFIIADVRRRRLCAVYACICFIRS